MLMFLRTMDRPVFPQSDLPGLVQRRNVFQLFHIRECATRGGLLGSHDLFANSGQAHAAARSNER